MAKEPIPTGRIRRTAKLGGLIGGQAARAGFTRALNVTRKPPPTIQRALALSRDAALS